jgi:hypothetical protein
VQAKTHFISKKPEDTKENIEKVLNSINAKYPKYKFVKYLKIYNSDLFSWNKFFVAKNKKFD